VTASAGADKPTAAATGEDCHHPSRRAAL